jgi:diguanylate cyclase (GGDEF)-like protein
VTKRDRQRWTATAAYGCILGFFLWLWLEPGGERTTVAFSDLASVSAAAAAALACLYAARRTSGRVRLGWALMGAGMVCTGTGEVIWTWFDLVLGVEVPAVSIADVAYLAQVPLTLAGMVALLCTAHRGDTLRTLLDGLIIAVSFLYVSWATVLGPAIMESGLSPLERVVTLAYPLGDVATASMVFIVLSTVDSRLRSSLTLAGAGLLALAFADSAYAYLAQHDSYSSGDLIDTAWFASFVLVAVAGLRANDSRGGRTTLQDPWRRVGLPYIPLAVALATSVVVEVSQGSIGPVLYLAGTALVVLVVARQLVTLRDNLVLTRRLEKSLAVLSGREEQLRHLAFHDPLTGLANRALFQDRVEHAIASQQRLGPPISVLYIDLDGFKAVNDALGHGAGDTLLRTVGKRLQECARPGDTVARLGGDEFAILIENSATPAVAATLASRVVAVLAKPVPVEDAQVRIGASVGVAIRDCGTDHAGEVLREADCAMYAAKLQGKGRYVMFEPHMKSAFATTSVG